MDFQKEKILELRSILKKGQLELQELKVTLKQLINLKEELIDLFINLSALNAVNNFSEKDIQHIDMIIEVAEMEIPEKLEKYFQNFY